MPNEKLKKENISEDEVAEFYLKMSSKYICKPVWIQCSNKYKLDEDYLYVMLKNITTNIQIFFHVRNEC